MLKDLGKPVFIGLAQCQGICKRITKKKCFITEILVVSQVKITSGPCIGFSRGVMSVLCCEMMSKVPGLSKK